MWEKLGSTNGQRALKVATISALGLGLFLRVYLYAIRPSTMWEDESYWAWKTLNLPVLNQPFRPAGFLVLTKWLSNLLGPSGFTFRAIPFVASLVGLLATPYVANRLFRSELTRLAVVVVMATHPAALTLAVEFKQYGVELGVFVAILASYLHYRERPSKRSFALLLGLAWLAFFFSIIVIFLYPALFGVLLWDAFKAKQFRALAGVAGVALLCVATIVTMYFTSWRRIDSDWHEKKWGDKYDVFYTPNAEESRTAWSIKKYVAVATLPNFGRERWPARGLSDAALERAVKVDRYFWLGLHGLGIFWLIRQRRIRELLWLWSPIVVMTVFNLLGRWPTGAFRTNAGFIPFTLFLAAFGLEAAAALRPQLARVLLPLGFAFVVAPPLIMRPDWFVKGCFAPPGQFNEVFDALVQTPAKPKRTVVLMENSSCRPWKYYANYDAQFEKTTAPEIRKRFAQKCSGNRLPKSIAALAANDADFWILVTNRSKDTSVERATRQYCRKPQVLEVGEGLHKLWHCEPKKRK